jgi:hypothetical protein
MTPTPVRAAAAVATLLIAAGCSDAPTSPRTPAPMAVARAGTAVIGVSRIPNSVRYRDAGTKPATGRAGSASLQALALLGRDGLTILEVTSGSAAQPGVARGEIAKLQVKQFAANGAMISTTNAKPAAAFFTQELVGLPRGSSIQVQGNIRGIDRARTDVVTLTAPVVRRPDLAVSNLLVPPEVVVGQPVPVSAVVREVHGDVGATADCVLLVDGAEAGRGRGIWVDAGDAVTCGFMYAFATGGHHAVSVRVSGVVPRDDDPANDAVLENVHAIVEVPSAFLFNASASDKLTINDWMSTELSLFADGGAYEWTARGRDSIRVRTALFSGALPRAIDFPVERLELEQRSGGASLHAVDLTDVVSDVVLGSGGRCVSLALGSGVIAVLCTHESLGLTQLVYRRDGTAVTYYGQYHADAWEAYSSGPPSYVVNFPLGDAWTTGASIGEAQPGDYEFRVRLTDGDWRFIEEAAFPLSGTGPVASELPLVCRPEVIDGGTRRRFCSASTAWETLVSGTISGLSPLP